MSSPSSSRLRLSFLGAAQSVTGSRFLLETAQSCLMVDCGLSQERDMQSRTGSHSPCLQTAWTPCS